jgi:hypothetical protein
MSPFSGSSAAVPQSGDDWAIEQTHFTSASAMPGMTNRPVALIDVGDGNGGLDHPLLRDRTTYVEMRLKRTPIEGYQLHGAHAAEVAGVIAQRCDAKLIVYDIGTTAGWDEELFVLALQDIINRDPRPAVVNISVGWGQEVPGAAALIRDCIEKYGISVVVAMGDDGAFTDIDWYPATQSGVIAVAGTDTNDLPLADSDTGKHVWIAAPGQDIITVVAKDELGTRNGTSFAAAQVSAAVWHAMRSNSGLTPAKIKQALGDSAVNGQADKLPHGLREKVQDTGWNIAVGKGRLDVAKFLDDVVGVVRSQPVVVKLADSQPTTPPGDFTVPPSPRSPDSQAPRL